MTLTPSLPATAGGFRHEALLYAGEADFLGATAGFVSDGVAADERVLVVLNRRKIDLLRERLGSAAQHVEFADMQEVGSNPARIIPAWHAFLERHVSDGRPVRGVGEPIWAERSPAELVECQRHESLLNVAFNRLWPFWLLCPYDVSALAPEVLHEAHRSHPYLEHDGVHRASRHHAAEKMADDHLGDPLPPPPVGAVTVAFTASNLRELRRALPAALGSSSLGEDRLSDLVLAVTELTTNSVRHGGGVGVVQAWTEHDRAVVQVADGGRLRDPLAGRREPDPGAMNGRGLWLVNQLCDLVQVRADDEHLVVRVHVRAREGQLVR